MKVPNSGLHISKVESRKIITIAIIVAVGMFCLVGSKQLLKQASYQRKVINARNNALKQLNTNVASANDLIQRYQIFNNTNPNIIGGKNTSDPDVLPPDGDNGRIVLDALPSKYDFPALITSLYKTMAIDGIKQPAVTATDESSSASQPASPNPQTVSIPVTISGSGSYKAVLLFIKDLEKSVRPIDVTNVSLTGSNSTMNFTLQATTYYQPAKTAKVLTKEIK